MSKSVGIINLVQIQKIHAMSISLPAIALKGVPTSPDHKLTQGGGADFASFMKNQASSFLTGTKQAESMLQTALVQQTLPTEQLAPMMAQLMLEFDQKRQFVSSLAGMLNKLMQTPL